MKIPQWLLLFGLICYTLTSCEQRKNALPSLQSGWYGKDLQIAYNPSTKELSAFFDASDPDSDSCRFYMAAKMLQNKANLITWHLHDRDNKAYGVIMLSGKDSIEIRMESDLLPCQSKLGFENPDIRNFTLTSDPQNWNSIRTIKSLHTPAFSIPDSESDTLAILQRAQVIRTLEEQEDWIRGEFWIQTDTIQAWIRKRAFRRYPG